MAITDTLRSLSARLASATRGVQKDIADLRSQIASKRQALDRARGLALPRQDIETHIAAAVQDAGAAWLHTHSSRLLYEDGSVGSPQTVKPRLPWNFNEPLPFGALAAGDPEQAEAILRRIVARLEYEAGPPAAERPALIKRLERELADLEAAEEQAVDEAAAAGLVIEHRPEVATHRYNVARAREIEEQRSADRKRRQDAIDAAHAAHRR